MKKENNNKSNKRGGKGDRGHVQSMDGLVAPDLKPPPPPLLPLTLKTESGNPVSPVRACMHVLGSPSPKQIGIHRDLVFSFSPFFSSLFSLSPITPLRILFLVPKPQGRAEVTGINELLSHTVAIIAIYYCHYSPRRTTTLSPPILRSRSPPTFSSCSPTSRVFLTWA